MLTGEIRIDGFFLFLGLLIVKLVGRSVVCCIFASFLDIFILGGLCGIMLLFIDCVRMFYVQIMISMIRNTV